MKAAVVLLTLQSPLSTNYVTAEDGFHALRAEDGVVYDGAQPLTSAVFERVRLRRGARSLAYRGVVEFSAHGDTLVALNRVGVDDYLEGVLYGELGSGPDALLAAQAVVSRTLLAARRGSHGKADVCDLTHCQLYAPPRRVPEPAKRAVADTRGTVLVYRGKVEPVYFSASCGGFTASASEAWGGEDVPYLRALPDSACRDYTWGAFLPDGALSDALSCSSPVGLRVSERGESGRVTAVSVGGREVKGYDFLRAVGVSVGWNKLRSASFTLSRQNGGYAVEGRGFGHGVGLCQSGARAMALAGRSADDVLSHYFPDMETRCLQRP